MRFFDAIANFFSRSVNQIPAVGPILSLAIDLGAAQWVVEILVKAISRVFKIDDKLSTKIVSNVVSAVKVTSDEISKGSLESAEDKQIFAANALKDALKDDPDFNAVESYLSMAPLLIELVYQLMKLKDKKS